MASPLPAIRPLEAIPVERDGGVRYLLRDPQRYSDHEAWLTPQALYLAAQLDGRRTAAEVAAALGERFGIAVAEEEVEAAVAQLDAVLFLDSPRFRDHKARLEAAFAAAPVRPAANTAAYEADPERLPAFLDAWFTAEGGPGGPPGPASGPAPAGLVAPHIDLHRGGPAYAHAYRALAEAEPPETFVVLGTAHAGLRHPFACLAKGYDTPLGPVALDRELAAALEAACPWAFEEAAAHRTEHSVELQVVWLRHLFGDRARLLPVLVDGLHDHLASGAPPESDRRREAFLAALGEAVARLGRRVTYVAAVDLSHVGTHFGDPEPLDAARLAAVERVDRELLAALLTGDAAAFFERWRAGGDATRVCGAAPLYCLRRLTAELPGRLLCYRQCHTPEADLMVSCAAALFPRPEGA
ncbi:MAG: AmmeMemoRadiSam system protein B [Nitrospirae bacterium]|nr:MAG: AmmeMemoRadiSam system protein B [Nitrospirota bacterium]